MQADAASPGIVREEHTGGGCSPPEGHVQEWPPSTVPSSRTLGVSQGPQTQASVAATTVNRRPPGRGKGGVLCRDIRHITEGHNRKGRQYPGCLIIDSLLFIRPCVSTSFTVTHLYFTTSEKVLLKKNVTEDPEAERQATGQKGGRRRSLWPPYFRQQRPMRRRPGQLAPPRNSTRPARPSKKKKKHADPGRRRRRK